MSQVEEFIDGLLGSPVHQHALSRPGEPGIILCGDGGWGTDHMDRVTCSECRRRRGLDDTDTDGDTP